MMRYVQMMCIVTYLYIATVKLAEKVAPGTENNGSGVARKQELASPWMPLLRRMIAGME